MMYPRESIRMPVPMPLTRFCDGARASRSSAPNPWAVRSLWMFTTAARTRSTTSTTGVRRGVLGRVSAAAAGPLGQSPPVAPRTITANKDRCRLMFALDFRGPLSRREGPSTLGVERDFVLHTSDNPAAGLKGGSPDSPACHGPEEGRHATQLQCGLGGRADG